MFHTITHIGPPIGKHLIKCRTCGDLIHWVPLPDQATVSKYYEADQFYSGDKPHSPPDWFLKEQREHRARLWNPYYRYLWELLDSAMCPGKSNPVIDIGCGTGWFMHYLQRQGYITIGVEPSEMARRWSPVADRIVSSNEFIPFRGHVVLNLVLEHIPDPETWLRREVLPHLDGRLLVTVPNDFNPLQRLVSKGNKWFINPVHVNYFNRQSLQGVLERVGLKVVHTGATFPMELFLLAGLDYRKDEQIGRKCHNWRLRLEQRFGVRMFQIYGVAFRMFGVGREIVMVAERR